METLEDVQLEGVALVSDDPSTWKVSKQALRFDDPLAWLEHLHEQDECKIAAGISDSMVDTLLGAAEEFCDVFASTAPIPYRHHVLGEVLKRMVRDEGLALDIVGPLVGLQPVELVKYLAPSADRAEDAARLEAERLMRKGVLSTTVEQITGLDRDQRRRWAETLGIEQVVACGSGRVAQPLEVREEALRLYDEGWKPQRITDHLNEVRDLPSELKVMTVYKWINRRKHKEAS